MSATDPRVTLTGAEIERLCDALEDSDAEYRVEQRVAREVEHLVAARLAPIRALADEWTDKYGTCGCPTNGGEQLRAALEATEADLSASQDHDGAEGQGEGEKAGEGVRCNRHGQLDRSVCGFCHDAYVECTRCGVYSCPCNTFPCEPEDAPR